MRFARYWIPALVGFVIGSTLSLKMFGTPMRDLLAIGKARAGNEPAPGAIPTGAQTLPEENDRFVRIFSALQESRNLKRRSDLHSALANLGAADLEALMTRAD